WVVGADGTASSPGAAQGSTACSSALAPCSEPIQRCRTTSPGTEARSYGGRTAGDSVAECAGREPATNTDPVGTGNRYAPRRALSTYLGELGLCRGPHYGLPVAPTDQCWREPQGAEVRPRSPGRSSGIRGGDFEGSQSAPSCRAA